MWWCMFFTPVDINNSECKIYWLVRNDAEENKDYKKDDLMWVMGYHN